MKKVFMIRDHELVIRVNDSGIALAMDFKSRKWCSEVVSDIIRLPSRAPDASEILQAIAFFESVMQEADAFQRVFALALQRLKEYAEGQ